jgi:hypothetical protein
MAEENPSDCVKHLRMSPDNFDELLVMIEPSIRKKDIAMRMAIPTRTKLEITLRYLASGGSFRTLHHLHRVPAPVRDERATTFSNDKSLLFLFM